MTGCLLPHSEENLNATLRHSTVGGVSVRLRNGPCGDRINSVMKSKWSKAKRSSQWRSPAKPKCLSQYFPQIIPVTSFLTPELLTLSLHALQMTSEGRERHSGSHDNSPGFERSKNVTNSFLCEESLTVLIMFYECVHWTAQKAADFHFIPTGETPPKEAAFSGQRSQTPEIKKQSKLDGRWPLGYFIVDKFEGRFGCILQESLCLKVNRSWAWLMFFSEERNSVPLTHHHKPVQAYVGLGNEPGLSGLGFEPSITSPLSQPIHHADHFSKQTASLRDEVFTWQTVISYKVKTFQLQANLILR